ncbi:hypothetical protein ACFV8Z_24215 [Streptomyces sp. NPDC059837]|uniref:hypothetical protein n=1 Tax=Streptomyces sp. NPDC059837 TaxID=3346968 RepID=UPI00364ADD86
MAPAKPVKGNNGLKHRREKRRNESQSPVEGPRTYRPEELLSPAGLLARFTERAQELMAELGDDERPTQASVTSALRQAVLEAFRTREEYLARMVETDLFAIMPNQKSAALKRSIRSALVDQGVRCVDSPDEREHFVVVEGEGETFEVLRPAYLDQATGKLILSGQLRRIPALADTDQPDEGKAANLEKSE